MEGERKGGREGRKRKARGGRGEGGGGGRRPRRGGARPTPAICPPSGLRPRTGSGRCRRRAAPMRLPSDLRSPALSLQPGLPESLL